MKCFIIITGLLSLLAACNSSSHPNDNQTIDREEEVNPRDAAETNSFSKDEGIPSIVP